MLIYVKSSIFVIKMGKEQMGEKNGKRLFKQYQIIKEKGLRVNYGTTDRNNPVILYVRAKGNIKPVINKKSYYDDVMELKKHFKQFVKENVNNLKSLKTEKYLCNIDVSENGLSYNKSGHFRYEIFLKPIETKELNIYENDIINLTNNINNEMTLFLNERGINTF